MYWGHVIGSRFSNPCIYVILFHLQFLLSFVLRHVANDDLFAGFQAADDLDVVVVALAEADLAGMEEVAVEDEEGVVAGAAVEGAVTTGRFSDSTNKPMDRRDNPCPGAPAHICSRNGFRDQRPSLMRKRISLSERVSLFGYTLVLNQRTVP